MFYLFVDQSHCNDFNHIYTFHEKPSNLLVAAMSLRVER